MTDSATLAGFIPAVIAAADAAGQEILKVRDRFEPGRDVATKGDGSPVTVADRAAEAAIARHLAALTPEIPLIAEESEAAEGGSGRQPGRLFWCVDPLDGTRDFVQGHDGFTVNIALVVDGRPTLGVVHAPARRVTYCGHGPGTARRLDGDGDVGIAARRPPATGLTVLTSRSHGSPEEERKFLAGFTIAHHVKQPGALKICAVADGTADLYPRFGPTSEWDTAAGEAVLVSAGGFLGRFDGTRLDYGRTRERYLNPPFLAHGRFDPAALRRGPGA